MTWKEEIFRAFLLAFGTLQIITNLTYIAKKNGLILARKQHQELPANISDGKMRLKVVCMLFFGILFFVISLCSYILHSFNTFTNLVALILFAVYAVTEALYYRYWKTFGFASITLVMLLGFLIL